MTHAPSVPAAVSLDRARTNEGIAGFDYGAVFNRVTRAINHRNLRACNDAVAQIPAGFPASAEYAVMISRASCLMFSGACETGAKLVLDELKATEQPYAEQTVTNLADTLCPIQGDLETRIRRVQSQLMRYSDHVEWCETLAAPAREAADEAASSAPRQLAAASYSLRLLAKCYGVAKRCDAARAAWAYAIHVDPVVMKDLKPELADCEAAPAPSPP